MSEEQPEKPTVYTLCIRSLPFNITDEELRKSISEYAKPGIIRFPGMNAKPGARRRKKGFAFVEVDTKEEMDKIIENMNGKEYEGRELIVEEAKNKLRSGNTNDSERPRERRERSRRDRDRSSPRRRRSSRRRRSDYDYDYSDYDYDYDDRYYRSRRRRHSYRRRYDYSDYDDYDLPPRRSSRRDRSPPRRSSRRDRSPPSRSSRRERSPSRSDSE